MKNQLPHFQQLALACDTHYPQFPDVADDPNFDSTPIQPSETSLRKIIEEHSRIDGVSAQNPTFYCLSHIYSASLGQAIQVFSGRNLEALPSWCSGNHLPKALSEAVSI